MPGMPRHLSPSSASTFEQCARRWKMRYIDQLPDPPGVAALAGTFAHRVLELLFQHPAGQRTRDRAKALFRAEHANVQAHSGASANATKPVLIWSDKAEKRMEAVMNVSASRFAITMRFAAW